MIKEKERTKEEQRERPCCGIRLQCPKCTVWPRNAYCVFHQRQRQAKQG